MRPSIISLQFIVGFILVGVISTKKASSYVPYVISREVVDENGNEKESSIIARDSNGHRFVDKREYDAETTKRNIEYKDEKVAKKIDNLDALIQDVTAELRDRQAKRQTGFLGRGPNGKFLLGRESNGENTNEEEKEKRQSGFLGRGPNGRFLFGRESNGKNTNEEEKEKRQSGFLGRGPNGRFLFGRESNGKNTNEEEKEKRQSGFLGRGPNGRFLVGREDKSKTENRKENH